MKSNPILSICIPTYNRAEYLDQTLYSITNQKIFQETEYVEIVISDNCSEDNTAEICENYIRRYGDKVRYYRNTENIKDKNFEKVLSYGNGRFLKLNNDTLGHYNNTLEKIIEVINRASANNDVIFFSNGTIKEGLQFYCDGLDKFVKKVSFYSTWIGSFGIWKSDFDSINDFSRSTKLQLVQVDVLFRLIIAKQNAIIDDSLIFQSSNLNSKGGYNFYKIFVTNYLNLLEKYKNEHHISNVTLFNEKTKLLIKFLIPWTLNIWENPMKYHFEIKGSFRRIIDKYMFHPILYVSPFYFVLQWCKKRVRKILIRLNIIRVC